MVFSSDAGSIPAISTTHTNPSLRTGFRIDGFFAFPLPAERMRDRGFSKPAASPSRTEILRHSGARTVRSLELLRQ